MPDGRPPRQFNLYGLLAALPVLGILPLVIFAGVMLYLLWDAQQEEARNDLQQTVRTLAVAVERELAGSVRELQRLAEFPSLETGSLERFHAYAQRMLTDHAEWLDLSLIAADGTPILESSVPFGSPPPMGRNPADAVPANAPVLSDIHVDARTGEPAIAISVPVVRDGATRWMLKAQLNPLTLSRLLQDQRARRGFLAAICDRDFRVVARNRELARFFGQQSTPEMIELLRATPGGSARVQSLDGVPIVGAWERLPSGWTVLIGMPQGVYDSPLERSVTVLGFIGLAVLAVGVLASVGLAQRITHAVHAARDDAMRLADGEPVEARPTRIRQLHDLSQSLHQGSRRLRQTLQERAALLVAEQTARARAERLQGLTAALAAARTADEVGEVMLHHGMAAAGADAAAVALREDDAAGSHRIVQTSGWPQPPSASDWSAALAGGSPLQEALRTGRAIGDESTQDLAHRHPRLAAMARAGDLHGWLALPIAAARGSGAEAFGPDAATPPLGAIALAFRGPVPIDRADRELLASMASQCAQALERVRLLQAERDARARAEAASRAKDEFIAMLGHELRNPLSAIGNAARLMGIDTLPPDQRARMQAVLDRQVRHMSRLVDDLLDVGRVLSGKIRLVRERIELAEVVGLAVAAMRTAGSLTQHRLDESLQPATVDGDPVRLEQIVTNLLGNAIKYTPAGGHIALTLERDGAWAVLRVRDDGIGMDTALLARAFDLFAQGDQDLQRSSGGLGIGLTLTRRLVEMHGGTIGADSDGRDLGSTFTVRLPLAPPA